MISTPDCQPKKSVINLGDLCPLPDLNVDDIEYEDMEWFNVLNKKHKWYHSSKTDRTDTTAMCDDILTKDYNNKYILLIM